MARVKERSRISRFLIITSFASSFVLFLTTAPRPTAEAQGGAQPAGIVLNPGGRSTIGGVFDSTGWGLAQGTGTGNHMGDDYYALDLARACKETSGQNLYAGISGKVYLRDYGSVAYGKSLVIYDDASKFALRYGHMKEYAPNLANGVRIDAGEYIGKVGNTGNVSSNTCTVDTPGVDPINDPGAHVHLALYKNVQSETDGPLATTSNTGPATVYAADYGYLDNRIPPAAPTSLTANPGSSSQMFLSWTYDHNADGFVLERKQGFAGTFSFVANVDKSQRGYTDSNLSTGTTYCYRLKAFRGIVESGYSNEVCAQTDQQGVATPVISPGPGSYSGPISISVSIATSGASIRYTTNGSDPTTSSTLYSSAFTLSASATVKARAFKMGMNDSAIASATFTISGTPGPSPSPSPSVQPPSSSGLPPPRNLTARLVNSAEVEIRWDYTWNTSFDPDQINVYHRELPNGAWVFVEYGLHSNNVHDRAVQSGKSYQYKAYALKFSFTLSPNVVSTDAFSNIITMPVCEYSVSAGATSFGAGSGTSGLAIQATPGCDWTAVSNNPDWIWVSPGGGNGSGSITYGVLANPSSPRSGSITAARQTVTITQAGNDTFTVGRFSPTPGYSVNSGQWFTGDFNGDGKGDLIHLTNSDYVHPWLSRGDGAFDVGQFRPWSGYNIQSGKWLTADFNGDGRTDLLHVTDADFVYSWLSKGDGSFNVIAYQHAPRYNNRSGRWLSADINGDGRTDLIHLVHADYIHPWLSNGNGTFDVKQFSPWPGYFVDSGTWLTGDFNGDGRTDLIHLVPEVTHPWLSNGDGTFSVTSFKPWPTYDLNSGRWLTGDFNGDGKADLMHITNNGYVHPWFSNGDGQFTVRMYQPISGYSTSAGRWIAGDLDADGKTDLVHMVGRDYVHPWLSRGNGDFAVSTFSPVPGYNGGSGAWMVVDLNGDKKADMVHRTESDYVHPWISNAAERTYSYVLALPGISPCPGCPLNPGIRVWANTATRRYHCAGTRWYGRTKRGQFVTQKQAQDSGYRAARGRICR